VKSFDPGSHRLAPHNVNLAHHRQHILRLNAFKSRQCSKTASKVFYPWQGARLVDLRQRIELQVAKTLHFVFTNHFVRHASLRTGVSTQRDSDEHRVIISYPLNIL